MPQGETNPRTTGSTRRQRSRIPIERLKLGPRIKYARETMGLSQGQLAKELGITRGAIGQWETDRGAPATGRLGKLVEFLGTSLEWLLEQPLQPADTPADTGPAGVASANDLRLREEARKVGVDLRLVVTEARQRHWRDENREALAAAHAFLAGRGLGIDDTRQP